MGCSEFPSYNGVCKVCLAAYWRKCHYQFSLKKAAMFWPSCLVFFFLSSLKV